MKQMDPAALSDEYAVRRLGETDIPAVLALMQGNPQYYRYCGGDAVPTAQGIRRDMTITPPGTSIEDKYYVGFFQEGQLAAIMDLIDGYPEKEIAFVGFFMLEQTMQGRGAGTRLIDHLCGRLKGLGFQSVRLGIDKGNPQSTRFWKKNGFRVIREIPQEKGTILLAERELS